MSSLQLQMSAQDGQVKLSWMGQISRAYCVDRERLDTAGQGVRGVLQNIADAYVQRQGSYLPFLPALARAGERLKDALFTPRDGSDLAEEICAYVNSLERNQELNITSDSTVHLPWNFIFTGDPFAMPAPTGQISDFNPFWANRFRIRLRFHQAALPPAAPMSRSRVKTLLALHSKRFKDAARALEDNTELQIKLKRLLGHAVGYTDNWIDCRSKWQEIKDSDSIFYIFAHSNGKKLTLNDDPTADPCIQADRYELDPNGFSVCFKKDRNNKTNTLCFINGCRTADGTWGNGFLSVTSAHGFQGFIGTEAEIPNDCATRYAVEFLNELLENGSSVETAYEKSRESCFPMSLWYSCYAQPEFRLSAE